MMESVRRNHRALLAGVVSTLGTLSICALFWPLSEPTTAPAMMMVQLAIMTVFMPLAAFGSSRPIDLIYRSGVTSDSFGAFMLVAGWLAGGWGLLDAIKLYLLMTGCGLMLMGAFVAARSFRGSAWAGSTGVFVLGSLVAGFHGAVLAQVIGPGPGTLAKLDLLSAGRDALGIEKAPAEWWVTALVYGAVAGLLWAVPLLDWPIWGPVHDDDESAG